MCMLALGYLECHGTKIRADRMVVWIDGVEEQMLRILAHSVGPIAEELITKR